MTRSNIVANHGKFANKKVREMVAIINNGNLNVLDNIGMPTRICQRMYLEDLTNEVRDVTIIEIGCPVQAEVCFYM